MDRSISYTTIHQYNKCHLHQHQTWFFEVCFNLWWRILRRVGEWQNKNKLTHAHKHFQTTRWVKQDILIIWQSDVTSKWHALCGVHHTYGWILKYFWKGLYQQQYSILTTTKLKYIYIYIYIALDYFGGKVQECQLRPMPRPWAILRSLQCTHCLESACVPGPRANLFTK